MQQKLFEEREKRISDAIALKVPDKLPILVFFGFFSARYAGMTVQEVMYDRKNLASSDKDIV